MAEFCSQCSPFKAQKVWDIDLFHLAIKLKRGRSESFVCEGCDIRGVYKDEEGNIYLAKLVGMDIKLEPVNIESLMTE